MTIVTASVFALQLICSLFLCAPEFSPPNPVEKVEFRSFDLSEDSSQINPVVLTNSGIVKGFIMKTIRGRNIAAFTKIPYATPPLGKLRFKAPKPVEKWKGVLLANENLPICEQLDPTQNGNTYRYYGQEDCLYLAIYTPKIDGNKDLPVLFYIHGGAYLFGQANFGPSLLLDHDVILVSVAYRLGPLGFFSTGDSVSPGNNGLKDQRLALEWVHSNIGYFGGDPSKITIMGQSAGAACAHLHTMTTRSKNLVRAGILHSGSALNFWTIRDNSIKDSFRLASNLKCPTNDTVQMVECLQNIPSSLIVAAQSKLLDFWGILPGVLFGPVIEKEENEESFLTEMPLELYKSGKVAKIPIISGFVRNEGEILGLVLELIPGLRGLTERKWDKVASSIFGVKSEENSVEIARKVRDFYLKGRPYNYNTKDLINNAIGDRTFVTGVHKALQMHYNYNQTTYGFYFNFKGKYGLADSFGLSKDWGVTHTDDQQYFFNVSKWFRSFSYEDQNEIAISEFVTNVWFNFINSGKPYFTNAEGDNVDFWVPINDPNNMKFLEINLEPKMVQEPFIERIKFWENLNLKY